jgi:quercetin dioxygenase-like cupin family protein
MADCPVCMTRRGFVTRAFATVLGLGVTAQLLDAGTVRAQVPGLVSDQLAKGYADYSEFVDGPADFLTRKLTFAPGTFIPWHTHPGPVWGIVNSGTLTAHYDLQGCVTEFGTGGAIYVPRGLTHEEHNDGTDVLEVVSTFILPAGSPTRIPAAPPSGSACGEAVQAPAKPK